MAKKHSRDAFYVLDDPLEAAIFSVPLEMRTEIDWFDRKKVVDPTYPP